MKIMIIACLSALFILSCSDNSTDDSKKGYPDMFPLAVGNYWIYSTSQLDPGGNTISGTEIIDSLVVTSKIEYLYKDAYLLLKYSNNILSDTTYIYKSDNSIYEIFDNNSVKIPALAPTWVTILDFNLKEWLILSNSYNQYVNFRGVDSKATYMQVFNALDVITDSAVFDGSKKFKIEVPVKMDRQLAFTSIAIIDTRADTLYYTKVNKTFLRSTYIEGIGRTLIQCDPEIITIKTKPKSIYDSTTVNNGWRSVLIRKSFK